jgi:DNA-binding CsgD family transcriptional regulator
MSNIEFFIAGGGSEVYLINGDKIEMLDSKSHIINEIYDIIKDQYSNAFKGLYDIYGKAWNFKFLMVRRFVKCNFANHDDIIDFDGDSFNFERISCPLRGECKYENIICNPEFNFNLHPAEIKVIELIAQNLEDSEIADLLFNSIHTIIKHRKNILKKLCLKNKADIIIYYNKHMKS